MSPHTPNYQSWNALILHRPHEIVDAVSRQLLHFGIRAQTSWPELPTDFDPMTVNIIFFDGDMGYDAQFPWPEAYAPVPMIALIGSEAPGRVAWAIKQSADAHLLKPIGSGGVYSAVMIATEAHKRRVALNTEMAQNQFRLAHRECLAKATAHLMVSRDMTENEAYQALRVMAMSAQMSIESMAARILEHSPDDLKFGAAKRNDRA